MKCCCCCCCCLVILSFIHSFICSFYMPQFFPLPVFFHTVFAAACVCRFMYGSILLLLLRFLCIPFESQFAATTFWCCLSGANMLEIIAFIFITFLKDVNFAQPHTHTHETFNSYANKSMILQLNRFLRECARHILFFFSQSLHRSL